MRLAFGLWFDHDVDLLCVIVWLCNVCIDWHWLHIFTTLITHRSRQFLSFLEGLFGALRATYLPSIQIHVPIRTLICTRSNGK